MRHYIDLDARTTDLPETAFLDLGTSLSGGDYLSIPMTPEDMRRVAEFLLQTAKDAELDGEATLVLSRSKEH